MIFFPSWMKILGIALGFIFVSIEGKSQDVEYLKEDSSKVVELLSEALQSRGKEHPMLYFGKKFIGIPYVAHTLEAGDKEHLIVNLHELDCTTFVETVVALSICNIQGKTSFDDYCEALKKIRYREGKLIDYTSRLHYFTWWGEDNEQKEIVKSISLPGFPFTHRQTIKLNYMTIHPGYYKHLNQNPDFVSRISQFEKESNGKSYPYIPKSLLNRNRKELSCVEDGDIISILSNKPGLDTNHIGIAVWGKDGKLHLLNASSLYHKVVLDKNTFYDYCQRQKHHIGIRVYRLSNIK